jgi:hypothetical protein
MRNDCVGLKLTASGQVYTGSCLLDGYLVGTDGVNDVTISCYDNTSAAGTELAPTVTYDAAKQGISGFFARRPVKAAKGIYIEITCAGSCEVFGYYGPA